MTLNPRTLDEIDFWDLDMFSEGDPHAAWTLLRREAPVWLHERDGGEPFHAVTRYDECRHVLGQPALFSSEANGIVLKDATMLAMGDRMMRAKPMIHTDPPRHQPLRKVISHNFTPRSIATLREEIRSYAVECLEEVADKRDVDFVTEVAHRIPAAIALSLMGVPRADWTRMAELEHVTVTGGSDAEFTHGAARPDAVLAASMELTGYFADLVRRRQEEGGGTDLLSQFLGGSVDGEALPAQQVVAEAGLLLAGGLDTTRAAASAGAMLPLLERPDQLRALQDDPGRLETAVDEFVRWASPITHEARTVMADTELGGVPLREGDRVAVWSPSANRDEEHFDAPFTYDTGRQGNRHLGFAYGEHYCLGVHLARLTLRVEFEEILTRFRSVEQTGAASRVRSNFVGGLKHLPVRMTPR